MRYCSLVRLNSSAFPGKTGKSLCSVLFKNNSSAGEPLWGKGVQGRFTLESRDFPTTLGFVPKNTIYISSFY